MKFNLQNRDVIETLMDTPNESLDMIYGDLEYNVGINYHGKDYTMKWNEYIDWYFQLANLCIQKLKNNGNLFMINYPKQNAYLTVEVERRISQPKFPIYIHDYAWVYNSNIEQSKTKFTTAHRSILHITKIKNNRFYKDAIAVPYQNTEDKRIKKLIEKGSAGRMPYSWFYFNLVKNVSKDKVNHPCQIPLPLFEMLLRATTLPDDKVFVLFGGSGKEIELALNLQREVISCETHPSYYQNILNLCQQD